MKGRIIHQMVIKVNLEVNLDEFTASKPWITRLKQLNGVVDRKLTKFVTEEYNDERDDKEVAELCDWYWD